ncbi:MAG: DUF6385 domain-containing protein [Bacillota bacterium]
MPNFKVFQDQASQLLSTVFQTNAESLVSTVIQTNADSLVSTVIQTNPDSLVATVVQTNADSLVATVIQTNADSLVATVIQTNPDSLVATVIQTNPDSLQTTLAERGTADDTETTVAPSTGATVVSTSQTVLSYSSFTFAAYNSQGVDTNGQLQVSADGTHFEDDGAAQTVSQGETAFFVPQTFTKYARLALGNAADTTTFQVLLQAQV